MIDKTTYIVPEIFPEAQVNAAFSMANRDVYNASNPVAGLDLGINTETDPGAIEQNRIAFLSGAGINPASIAFARQVHGNSCLIAKKPGLQGEADALITTSPEISVGVMVADCAAILLTDVDAGVAAAVHAGWRGAADGVLSETLQTMSGLGANPANILAWISPCISTENFEVGEEVAARFPGAFVLTDGFSKPHVDLNGFLMHQMLVSGLHPKNIESDGRCTLSDNRFYSYRREGSKSGRMLAVISLIG